jgi:hypothetical protein
VHRVAFVEAADQQAGAGNLERGRDRRGRGTGPAAADLG